MRRTAAALIVVFAAVMPAVAHAQAQAGGHIKIVPENVGGRPARVLAGERWRVRGRVEPFIAGQRVSVRFYRHGRRIAARDVAILPGPAGSGAFLVGFRTTTAGRVTVKATHRATPLQATLVANPKDVEVIEPRARPGGRGPAVRLMQRRLRALGYVTGQPGLYDERTARAVLAFRKVAGLPRTETAGAPVFRRLARGGGHFRVRFPAHGRHVEADLSRQVLALIGADERVERIYAVSSGAPWSPTVRGSFRVYLKSPGINEKGMFYSDYFTGGYAIHGYVSVPVYAASHGCLRAPLADAIPIYRWIRKGTRVDVYA